MHYACFWQFEDCAEDLLECGALVSIENKYGESPVDKAPPRLAKRLMGKSLKEIYRKDLVNHRHAWTVCMCIARLKSYSQVA